VEALPFQMASRLVRPPAADRPTVAAKETDGRCAFFESDARLCSIHRLGGEAALPLTCRMFPRVVLQDGRGALVSLSHFCPTAAALLFDATGPDAVVEAPTSLVDDQHLDGLDATETWSPLLRPGVLMDIDSYAAWERCGIGLLLHGRAMPWEALARLDRATAIVTGWTPDSDRPLLHWTTAAFDDTMNLPTIGSLPDGAQFVAVCGVVPPAMSRPASVEDLSQKLTAVVDALQRHSQAVNRWLAARLFGTWIAYQGSGLLTIARYLHAALDVLTVEIARVPGRIDRGAVLESIRRTDYLLVHLADSQQIARLLS